MGEARRRKLAGSYPDLSDPIEAARRFWCGRGQTHVEDFRAPAGTVAITLDVHGAAPSTYLIDAAKLVDAMADVGRLVEAGSYYKVVRFVAAEFVRGKQTGDETPFPALGLACFWTALHHPQLGGAMRTATSEALRRDGRAHITWQFSPATGLALALAETFVDLEAFTAGAPKDAVIAIAALRSDAGGTQH